MKRFCKAMTTVCLGLLLFSSSVFGSELIDIEGHWASESIYRLIGANAINGYEDNTFRPDNNITVAEFLKILVEYTDYKKVLVGEMWPDWFINTAKYYKFIDEDDFSDFDRFITRSEVAKILGNFIDLKDVKKSNEKFKDSSDEVVLKLANLDVIKGYEDNSFRGDNLITRAEASTIICRAMNARRNIVANRKYDLSDAELLTNIGRTPSYDSDYKNRYEVKNNKILFYDSGRYAHLDGYSVDEKNIKNKTLINLIKSLIQEDAYVGVSYVPDKLTYDQITVNYGKREGYVYNHSFTFGFIFYPDKQFELRKYSMNDELSENCFMKIIISKMWKDLYDVENGEYSHKLNNEKLLKALKAIFDEGAAIQIYEYIQEWRPILFENGIGNRFAEMKKIGNYEVNLYTTGNTRVELYISK